MKSTILNQALMLALPAMMGSLTLRMTEPSRNAAFTSLDELLAASIDDLDDLPTFACPPPGAYIVNVAMEEKEINGKPAISANYEIVEVVELTTPTESPPKSGDKFNTLFTMNEIGVGKLKEFCLPFANHFNEKGLSKLVREVIQNLTVSVSVKNRQDKEDKEKFYPVVKVLSVA